MFSNAQLKGKTRTVGAQGLAMPVLLISKSGCGGEGGGLQLYSCQAKGLRLDYYARGVKCRFVACWSDAGLKQKWGNGAGLSFLMQRSARDLGGRAT